MVPRVRVSKPPLMRVAVGVVTVEKAVPLRRTVAVMAGEAGRLPLGTWTKARVARVPPVGMVKVETKLGVCVKVAEEPVAMDWEVLVVVSAVATGSTRSRSPVASLSVPSVSR